MLDLTGHMIIWGGLFAHGDGSTGLIKVVFLLRPIDGRARVWRQRNISFQGNHILGNQNKLKLSPETQNVISILTLIWYLIKDVELYKHLGAMFSNDCKWTKHID